MSKKGLRSRQIARWPRTSDRLEAATQPPQPTVAEVAGRLATAVTLHFIRLTVPRSSRPSGRQVTLMPRGGPLSAKDSVLDWDPYRRAVSADWSVEDLRAWVEEEGAAG